MHIIITGGHGFLGLRLTKRMLADGIDIDGVPRPVDKLTLIDVAPAPFAIADKRVHSIVGDLPGVLAGTPVLKDASGIIHLAAVVSGEAEANFDIGMRVNLDGTRALLEWCRTLPQPPRVLFSSSVAVFGRPLPDTVQDDTLPTPQGSYGIQKFIGEQLVADFSRKGFIDGRSVRLPTIVVRPGKPNKAASSFASSIIREPLAGVAAVCPVPLDTPLFVLSPDGAVNALMRAFELPAATWGSRTALNVPGLTVTVHDMLHALEQVAGAKTRALVKLERDPAIERIVLSWPARFNTARGYALGFRADQAILPIVAAHRAEM